MPNLDSLLHDQPQASRRAYRSLTCVVPSVQRLVSPIRLVAGLFGARLEPPGSRLAEGQPAGRGLDAGGGRHTLGGAVPGWGVGQVMDSSGEGVGGSACAGVAGAQPYLGPRDGCGLGDMMIDGGGPAGCGRAGLLRPSIPAAPVWRQASQGASATGDGHGASAVQGLPLLPASASPAGWRGGVGPVAEAAQDVVRAAGEFAGDGQGGPVGVDPGGDVGVIPVVG
jgi:hypothetical protein